MLKNLKEKKHFIDHESTKQPNQVHEQHII